MPAGFTDALWGAGMDRKETATARGGGQEVQVPAKRMQGAGTAEEGRRLRQKAAPAASGASAAKEAGCSKRTLAGEEVRAWLVTGLGYRRDDTTSRWQRCADFFEVVPGTGCARAVPPASCGQMGGRCTRTRLREPGWAWQSCLRLSSLGGQPVRRAGRRDLQRPPGRKRRCPPAP